MLTVRQLDKEQVIEIYNDHLLQDFVPAEQKPLDIIMDLMDRKLYVCFGLYDEEQFVAYAFFSKAVGYKDLLIDYFAVCNGYRNRGYGSQFLALLKEEITEFNSIIFEVESGRSAANEDELKICEKRLAFYHRNGLKDTNLCVSLFGVDMSILYLALHQDPSDETVEIALDAIYDTMFGKELHSKYVFVSKR